MAVDARKRQKKLEKKKAKEKAKRRDLAQRNAGGMAARLEAVSAAPVLHSCASADVWDQGIGEVLISRRLNNGNVAFAVFLVDMYCLGVKNAMAEIAPHEAYKTNLYDKVARRSRWIPMKPEAARKLVEGAVQYAADLGLSPHADYHKARAIFGDISAESCREEFRYGKNGMPLFVNGPFDDEARCRHIVKTLTDRLGPDGFRCVLHLSKASDILRISEVDGVLRLSAGDDILDLSDEDEFLENVALLDDDDE